MAETLPDLAALLPSWQLALKAERKSPGTIRTYTDGVTKFLRWCETNKRHARAESVLWYRRFWLTCSMKAWRATRPGPETWP